MTKDKYKDTDKELEHLLEELKSLDNKTLSEFSTAYTLISNLEEAAVLNMSIGKYRCSLPIIHIEIIQMFRVFLEEAIEYLEYN